MNIAFYLDMKSVLHQGGEEISFEIRFFYGTDYRESKGVFVCYAGAHDRVSQKRTYHEIHAAVCYPPDPGKSDAAML